MYCNHCGKEIADGAKFCSYCGASVEENKAGTVNVADLVESEPVKENTEQPQPEKKHISFDEFQWNVEDYPDRSAVEETEDVDFDWNADPKEITDDVHRKPLEKKNVPEMPVTEGIGLGITDDTPVVESNSVSNKTGLTEDEFNRTLFGETGDEDYREESPAGKIDKFYTFNKKNEEFQQLLNKEYEKVRGGNAIEHEMTKAEAIAQQRFESRTEDQSMDAFFEKEGIVKPYQPKGFESDVLQRIEAQEAEKEAKRKEEEARLAAIEQARKEAEAKMRLEEDARIKAEEEAKRIEEEAQRRLEEEARIAEENRIREEEELRRRAEEEARLAEEREARRREEEERIKAEEKARLEAEAEARKRAEAEARRKAEADLKAAQEAAKIKAQQEARLAAEAEAKFKAEQEWRRRTEEESRNKLEEERRRLADEANKAVAEEEVRKALEQTAQMREEEATKIREAVASMRNGTANMNRDVMEAHEATRNQINEMAKARDEYFSQIEHFEHDTDYDKSGQPVTRDTIVVRKNLKSTKVFDKAAILAGINGETQQNSTPVSTVAPASDEEFFHSFDEGGSQPQEAAPIDFRDKEESIDDLLTQFESINNIDDAPQEDASYFGEPYAADNDVQTDFGASDLSDVGEEKFQETFSRVEPEASDYMHSEYDDEFMPEEADKAMDEFFGVSQENIARDEFPSEYSSETSSVETREDEPLSKKEQKRLAKEARQREKEERREAKRQEKDRRSIETSLEEDDDMQDYDESHKSSSGGKGRVVLKVILVILIIIFALEVIGIGIRVAMPQSKAAEFIDVQLNKIINLITGDDTQYTVVAAQVRMDPVDDKTDFIRAAKDRNIDGNIKEIVYNSALGYDDERDGKISDLVLSQPITQVEWGRDDENYPVYFDQEVVGEIIEFESGKVNLMNKGDETVLRMVDSESPMYKQVAELKNQSMKESFERLEIGEIRQAGSNYFVWVNEIIGDEATEKVYAMYPMGEFNMLIKTEYLV